MSLERSNEARNHFQLDPFCLVCGHLVTDHDLYHKVWADPHEFVTWDIGKPPVIPPFYEALKSFIVDEAQGVVVFNYD